MRERDSNTMAAVALAIGLLAAGLAFAAEYSKKSIIVHRKPGGSWGCQGALSRDEQLAKAAAVLIAVNVICMIAINCTAYEETTQKVPVVSVILLVFSMLLSVSGTSVLAKGASVSNNQKKTISRSNCNDASGYYIAGGVLALKACGLGIASFQYLIKTSLTALPTTKENVEMANAMTHQPDITQSVHAI